MTAGQRGWRTDVKLHLKGKIRQIRLKGRDRACRRQPLDKEQLPHGLLSSLLLFFADISSGSSADWTYGKAGIKFSYGVELRDTGKFGFLLPEDQILPSGKETLQALIALSNYVYPL